MRSRASCRRSWGSDGKSRGEPVRLSEQATGAECAGGEEYLSHPDAPAPTLPAIVFHQIARRPVHVKKGYVNPIVDVLMQFDVLATTYEELDAVASELKRALYDYKDTSPHIYDVMVEGERDGDEIDLRQFHRSIDCSIWLAEE